MMYKIGFVFVVAAFVCLVNAEKLNLLNHCGGSRGFGNGEIHEVRITPCPETNNRRPCVLRKRTNVTVEIDFTPRTNVANFQSKAFWANKPFDLPLPGMNANGCAFASCPLKAAKRTTYSYNLFVSRSFPTRGYDVKWKLSGPGMSLCFQTPIQIVN